MDLARFDPRDNRLLALILFVGIGLMSAFGMFLTTQEGERREARICDAFAAFFDAVEHEFPGEIEGLDDLRVELLNDRLHC